MSQTPKADLSVQPDTRDRLLDAAEAIYSEKGLDGTSVRALTSLAGANLAAVGYHFGSKNALIQEAIRRRFEWLIFLRKEWLDQLEDRARPQLPDLEDVVDVLLRPILNPYPDQPERSADLRRFFSRVHSEPPDFQKSIPVKGFQETTDRFVRLFQRLLPELSAEDIYWRMHFSIGPLIGTLTHGHRLREFSRGLCNPDDIEDAITRLRSFICAGMRAPAKEHPIPSRRPA
ncbi:MAG: TetR family transcriptional regulator [Opitutaceae bacterium]